DILEAMNKDCGMPLSKLHVDGKMTSNDLLMQLQADLVGIPVLRAQSWDMSALGVAIVAGHSATQGIQENSIRNRDARYTKWKMAVQRSLGWASTKKSITMTGQKRKSSMFQSAETLTPPGSRKNSTDIDNVINNINPAPDDDSVNIDDIIQHSARKFSIFVPLKQPKDEHTILDDAEYYMNKKECDYGMCQCCQSERRLQTDWKTIEEIIENDPEIIFDSEDQPKVCETKQEGSYEPPAGGIIKKRVHIKKIPGIFRNICKKFTNSSPT
ncbi:jg27612, partial [Pararge aegeria aegeria]